MRYLDVGNLTVCWSYDAPIFFINNGVTNEEVYAIPETVRVLGKEISGVVLTRFTRDKCHHADDRDVQEYMKLTKIKEAVTGDIICAHSPIYSTSTPLIKVMFQLLKHENGFCYMIEGSVVTLPHMEFDEGVMVQGRCLPANAEEIKEYMTHKTV